jgi:TRAP-type mannitol/chloroaromatic compound transport system permease small subunit
MPPLTRSPLGFCMSPLISFFKRCSQWLDGFAEATGRLLAWLTLAMAVGTSLIVLVRVIWSTGSIASQEAITYMHALVLMLASAYALKDDQHVRVDILYHRFSATGKAWVNLLGHLLFLLPLSLAIAAVSWDFVWDAWANREGSADAGGLQGVYLLKALLLANAITLALQALSDSLRQLVTLTLADFPVELPHG